ncbi:DUF1830 domain-containing protein [Spirulina sp. 06S082]|uniref:DUF1830 domain-containing protein n=1 Tax=Spirulina sp. 06S082 TaxID=3110248 RepID=UPI002B20477C|nr:DUF1830 domain-containing protein [Spirulina sp. 06S082]MEA5469413.1 DUF1830 domain-containing protein [Spirulina sp. 06S082]
MSQILDPIPNSIETPVLCCYVNATSQIQIARITNLPNWYFERVVFPGQRLVFEALPEALLEIHSGMMASAILSDTIPCQRLRVNQEPEETQEANPSVQEKATNQEPIAAAV